LCQKNGVDEVVEFKIGFDGLTIASAVGGPSVQFTRKQLFCPRQTSSRQRRKVD
jgi:hypothetical protein